MIGTMRSVFSSARKASGRQLGYVDDGVGMKRSGFVRTLHLEEMMVSSVFAGCRRDPGSCHRSDSAESDAGLGCRWMKPESSLHRCWNPHVPDQSRLRVCTRA